MNLLNKKSQTFTEITLTKLDILDHFEKIKICIGYKYGSEQTSCMSKLLSKLSDVQPVYQVFDGWNKSTNGIKSYDKLPKNTQQYIQFISDFIGVPVKII